MVSAEALIAMQKELDAERRAYQRIWAKRASEIERLFGNLGGMYGDLQGIIGAALEPVEPLELPRPVTELPPREPAAA